MARVPISFYLNILAGILVLFNHYASSETGDVALNKVTGAAGRFYILFRDAAVTLQHGWTSRLETTLCGVVNVLPHDTAEFLGARYCDGPAQDAENTGGTLNDRQPRGGYGSSDFALVYYQPRVRSLEPRISVGDPSRKSPFSLGRPSLPRAVWEWASEVMVTIGILLLRMWGSYWWFKAPLQVTGVLAALSAFDYLIRASEVLRWLSQVCIASVFVNAIRLLILVDWQMYTSVVIDFLQCIEWEARCRVVDVGVVMMEYAYGVVTRARASLPWPMVGNTDERLDDAL